MISIDNVEILINQIFAHEPETVVMILENEEIIAIMVNDDWANSKFNDIREMCRMYKAPAFIKRNDLIQCEYIDLAKCEKVNNND